jgi:acetate kinase
MTPVSTGTSATTPAPAGTPAGVIIMNAGSSSMKASLLGPGDAVESALEIEEWDGRPDHSELTGFLTSAAPRASVVAHRVVHGGSVFSHAVLINDGVIDSISRLTDLAPLHQPRALAGIEAVRQLLPGLPAVACFDTAFHAGMPDAAARYALPDDWTTRFGLRRFGFHGLSHCYASRRAAQLLGREPGELRIVTCHLGAGASLAAVHKGRSMDTTMGFTPLEGLVMATRSGSVDPGLIIWLLQHGEIDAAELSAGLEKASGLAGLSGVPSGDMREVLRMADSGSPAALLAIEVYLHRLRREIAAMAAAMNGMDAVVFTGGIGEHSSQVRAAAVAGLEFLGMRIDPDRNQATADAIISRDESPTALLVVTAREDIEMARQARDALAAA